MNGECVLVTHVWLIPAASLLPARLKNRIPRLAELTVSSATVIISHLNSELSELRTQP